MFNFDFLLEGSTGGGMLPLILMLVAFIPIFFFMSRRQKKQERKEQELRDSLQVGDEVTTLGGIIGKVVSIKGETFVLETTKDKTKIRFLKSFIRNIDVKAADIAAAVMEVDSGNPAEADAPTEKDGAAPVSEKKKAKKKAKKEDDTSSDEANA